MRNNKKLQDLPNWDTAPDWAQYWAVDSDGEAYFWARKPFIHNDGFCTYVFGSLFKFAGKFDATNWQTSIQERPK